MTHQHEPRRLAVVVNPNRSDITDEFVAELDGVAEIHVVTPADSDDLVDCIGATARQFATIAVVGGDGTQRRAASALADTGTELAVVPGGTVNLLARVLGVDSPRAAAEAAVAGSTRTIDLGEVDGDTFVLNASSGYDAAVMRRVDKGAKRWGRLGYFMAGLRELAEHRPQRVTVTVDGERWFTGRAMTVMVTNFGQRGSAEFMVAPGSSPDDGLLDIVVQRSDSAPTMVRTIWTLARHRDPRPEDLVVGHGKVVDVRWADDVFGQRDGDDTGTGRHFHHRIRPSALCVRVPATL